MNVLSVDIRREYLFTENAKDLWNELKEQFGGEEYDAIRNQILLMDSLPYVAKTYSMVSEIEKRRVVKGIVVEMVDNAVMQTRSYLKRVQFNFMGRGTLNYGGIKLGVELVDFFPRTRNVNVNNAEYQAYGMENTPLDHAEEDTKSHKVLAVGRENGELYVLNHESFLSSVVDFYSQLLTRLSILVDPAVNSINNNASDSTLWHFRLGHCSSIVMKHVKWLNQMDCNGLSHQFWRDSILTATYIINSVLPHRDNATHDDPLVQDDDKSVHDTSIIPIISTKTSISNNTLVPTRVFNKIKRPSTWLNDYIVTSISDSLSLPTYSTSHMDFVANLAKIQEPYTYKKGYTNPDSLAAMQTEIDALESNDT
ncbi:hypothetical protein LIER_13619 [Lithospermum erythrorhizon]|uniref:GAG-pre-integrase domain-containing protein n=1 Tax=Lithospermum erythrorhizon TaxID=34254 RepID=A0AAV3PYK6_LITER